eukprot:2716165-Prymnesium_polylepis.1
MAAQGQCRLSSGEAPITTMEEAAAAAEPPVPEGYSSATVLPALMPGELVMMPRWPRVRKCTCLRFCILTASLLPR